MEKGKYGNIDTLILRYVDGTIDSRSLARLKSWAEASAARRAYVRRRLETAFSSAVAADRTPFDSAAAYARFLSRAAAECGRVRRRRTAAWRRVAAVAALVVLAVLPFAAYWQGRRVVEASFADIAVDVPTGARISMMLPDSTRVWLNSGSRLVYSQGFGVADRRLELSGEAYFEVAHDKDKPFVVHTRELNVTVVGTKFNLCNYRSDNEVTVSLVEGCVALTNNVRRTADIYMHPNQTAVLDKHTGRLTVRRTRAYGSASWTGNELFFDEALLSDIAKKIERCYGVSVSVADSVRGRRFYGSFRMAGGSPDEVLRAISATGDVNYKASGSHYTLY